MNYPEKLKIGDTIGICAPSCGIVNSAKQIKLDNAIIQLKELGYKIIETESVRKEYKGRSTTAQKRAEEFMELYNNPDVKLIIFATGGDFLCEMLDYLNFEELKKLPTKWLQGYSDISSLTFLFNTILDIPTMYSQTIKDYAMRPLYRNLTDTLKLESGENIIQKSFNLFEKDEFPKEIENPNYLYNLTDKVVWKNIIGGNNVKIEGRSIGGCLDCIMNFFGTKYDHIKEYIEKYRDDGIIWFFDVYEKSSSDIYKLLWQMKRADYFKYCNGIIFGRPLFVREDYRNYF